jgi:hypothetical protein
MAVKHAMTGIYVRSKNGIRLRDRKVQRLVRSMRIAMPWLEESDVPACRAWAQLEILADTAYTMLGRLSLVNQEDEPRRLLADYRQLRQAQLAFARELGMTPAARMNLRATNAHVALDVAATALPSEDDATEEPRV